MAYSLGDRFQPPPKYYALLDPGSYQNENGAIKKNSAPFLSNTPRKTQEGAKLWTQATYNQSLPHRIPNCSSMLSKKPRFPYEAFSAEDLEEILCKCGILTTCECPTAQDIPEEVICQGKVRRRIFKGPTPKSVYGDEGLSAPSRKDHGFEVFNDGSQRRIRKEQKEECPPFYDARVNESTAFYQGCKWSHRTSLRTQNSLEVRPGPADYYLERGPTENEICAEKVRAFKRKTSKQLRFIEMIQRKNILESSPGPPAYDPVEPKGTDLTFIGAKAKRFPSSKYEVSPGPADHWIRRDFDPIPPTNIICHAILPEPACFGTKTQRFKDQREEGPSPATYDIKCKTCNFLKCGTAAFGSSAQRFKSAIDESFEDDFEEAQPEKENLVNNAQQPCEVPTWVFKSKTVRMKPLLKRNEDPSPADFAQSRNVTKRSSHSQYLAPFCSSDGRFQPWYSWIPVHGQLQTPGPGQYSLEKPRCLPAFVRGPLYRAPRFRQRTFITPASNEYNLKNGLETVLATHNKRLKNNIKNVPKLYWEPSDLKKTLNYDEREADLLNRAAALLDTEELNEMIKGKEQPVRRKPKSLLKDTVMKSKPKMLRTFLYSWPLPTSI